MTVLICAAYFKDRTCLRPSESKSERRPPAVGGPDWILAVDVSVEQVVLPNSRLDACFCAYCQKIIVLENTLQVRDVD